MKTTSEACRTLAALALTAAVAAGCAATSGLDEPAGSGGTASPTTASPATERVVAGIAELVLTTRVWPTFEEARADPVRTVEDGSPLFAYIRATRPLGELAHPSNPAGTYAFSEYPHLFLQVGDVDSLRILSTCYVTLTSEEAGMRELVVPLAPLTFRPGQIPADCWLASVVAGRPGKRTYEVRLAGFAGKFESWLPVPDLLAVTPVPTDLGNGAGDYATMLRATPLRSATLVASTAPTPAATTSNAFNPAALSPVSPNFAAALPAQRGPSVPTPQAAAPQATAPQALAPQAPAPPAQAPQAPAPQALASQPPASQPPAPQAPLSPARMTLEASPGITPGADFDTAPTSMPTSTTPSPTLRVAPAPLVLTPPPRPDTVILPPTSEPVITTPIPDPVVLTQPLRPFSPAPRPLSLTPAPGPVMAAPAPVVTPPAPGSAAFAVTPGSAPQRPEPTAASTFGSGSATSGSTTSGPAASSPASFSPAAYSPAAYSPPAIGAPSLATVAPSLMAPQSRPPALVAINSAPLPGPRKDIGNSRMELQLQTLTSALLGRRPSEAFFMDPQWTSSADPRGRVWQQHAHAAAIFKGASCSWQRIKAFRRPGASGLLDVEPAGEPIEINCSDLR